MLRLSILSLLLCFSVAACDDDEPAGLNCDESTLTYDNFGKAFFDDNCTECHSTNSADRRGAPSTINFETLALVKTNVSAAKRRAGNAATMPPSTATNTPAPAARALLVEWADCGTKN